jgi:hypothetical protein
MVELEGEFYRSGGKHDLSFNKSCVTFRCRKTSVEKVRETLSVHPIGKKLIKSSIPLNRDAIKKLFHAHLVNETMS